jgi:hypothetical protein
VLFVVAILLLGDLGNTPAETARTLSSHSGRLFAAFICATLASFSLLTFFMSLRDRLRVIAPARTTAGSLAVAAVASASPLFLASLAVLGGAGSAGSDDHVLTPATAALANDISYPLLVGGAMVTGFGIFCLSLAAWRSGLLPSWLCWSGVIVGVVLLASIAFFPMALMLLWVLVASIVLLTRPAAVTTLV